MKPTHALEAQAYFKSRCQDAMWRQLLSTWVEVSSGLKLKGKMEKICEKNGWDIEETYKKRLELWTDDIVSSVKNSDCYFVKDEMTDLILFASRKLDDTDIADLSICPSDMGFVYFEKPLPITDVRGRTMLIHIFLWKKIFSEDGKKMAVTFSAWNDSDRQPDEVAKDMLTVKEGKQNLKEYLALLGKFHWIHMGSIQQGQVIGSETKPLSEEDIEETRRITFNQETLEPLSDEEWEKYKAEVLTEPTNSTRLLYAYWLLMTQTLTSVSKERGDRAQRRRMEREKLPTEVVVVQFRKRRYINADTDETHEENAVEWSHRWIVGGHWRWQPYKDPVSKGVIKKRIWISPYVKGPEDKPLVAKSKVFVLAK